MAAPLGQGDEEMDLATRRPAGCLPGCLAASLACSSVHGGWADLLGCAGVLLADLRAG